MKTILLVTVLFLATLNVNAQHISSPDSTEKRTFVGIGLSNTVYQAEGELKYRFVGGVMPIVTLHFGYWLSKRSSIQAGLGYGVSEGKSYSTRRVSQDSVFAVVTTQLTKALVLPVTFKFTPFDLHKRLQLYGNASFTPVLARIKAQEDETYKGSTTKIYDEYKSSLTLIATAGLTLNYRLNKHLDIYTDGILFYHNFGFKRPDRRWIEDVSASIGVNYRL